MIQDKGLVKTVQFKNPKYIGDPINAVRIFNEKEVDELVVLDIDASVQNREPDYKAIEHMASECRMPLCYGGGVKTADQAKRIFELGVEKVAISSSAMEDPSLITRIAERVGSQSVVVVMDVKKKTFGGYEVFTMNGKNKTGKNPIEIAKTLKELGAGEVVINSIDNDGVMKGYDVTLAEKIRSVTNLPLTILGGAGTLADIGNLINKFGIIGASAGSLFVYKGVYKAVLINYPKQHEKDALIKEYFKNSLFS